MADPNTSATGGPLAPVPSPAPTPLEGQDLSRFIQQWIVGVTGLDGKLVRPRWQAEPNNIPDAGEAWCAVGILTRQADTFPQVIHDSAGDGSDQLQRQEQIDIQASFYDLGSDGQADKYCAILRDGLSIAQNREVLLAKNFQLAFTGEATPVPVILKTRWLYRVDLSITLRRWIVRTYPVRNLKSAAGTIFSEDVNLEIKTPWATPAPPTS